MSQITNISVGPFSLHCLQPGVRSEREWCQDLEEAEREKERLSEIRPEGCYSLIESSETLCREETGKAIDEALKIFPVELVRLCFSYYFTQATFCMTSQGENTFCHVASNRFQIPRFGSQFWRPSHPLPIRAYVVLVPSNAKTLIWNQSRSSQLDPETRALNWSVSTSKSEQYAEAAFQPNCSQLDRVDEQIASMSVADKNVFIAVHPLIRRELESPTVTRVRGEWLSSDTSSESEEDSLLPGINSSPLSRSSLIESAGSNVAESSSSSESCPSSSDEEEDRLASKEKLFEVVALTVLPVSDGALPTKAEMANIYLSMNLG